MNVEAVEILLVEDSPGDVRLTQEALKDSKLYNNLNVVPDGVEALAFLKHEGKWCMYSDGIYAEMHFTSPEAFFNLEFLSEKRFVKNEKGCA